MIKGNGLLRRWTRLGVALTGRAAAAAIGVAPAAASVTAQAVSVPVIRVTPKKPIVVPIPRLPRYPRRRLHRPQTRRSSTSRSHLPRRLS